MAQLAPPSPNSRPTSAYSYTPSQSYTLPRSPTNPNPPSDSDSNSDADSDLPLPFPAALSRADFLAPDFDAAAYLSALHTGGPASRHQTLEDLRAELRERSAAISAELLELVNANYTAFLGLGDGLKGGEDRVGDVRVALLGFRRAVEEIQGRVRERRVEVGRVNAEVAGVKTAVECGRRMLELDERVAGLERRLAIGSAGEGGKKGGGGEEEGGDWGDDFDSAGSEEEDEEEDGVELVSSSPAKLTALAKDGAEYNLVKCLCVAVIHIVDVRLQQGQERLDVIGQHLGGKSHLAHCQPHHTAAFPVLVRAYEFLNCRLEVGRNSLGLLAGHQTPGTEDFAEVGFLQCVLAVLVADKLVEWNVALPDALKKAFLSHCYGTKLLRLGHQGAVLGTDNADARVGFDRERKTNSVPNNGAAFAL
ncbi:hypothetical protein CHGG_07608 [Chaetomium globosum CBS 148.51]|uniref:Conserved oligomeric Golgi complex subunit 2 n=1 Tax=Chaetomium globosum (strain ATCC 6205 / CBS 148.51 / DSM 1962 / NBRC 6347 / NRRL 1970) TaxID=306901 RepID=Q2GWP6_CHAGB|nr:uncharacterized protein CHGG_07608 [Chaetomium globosum CBS 148.51]EAQ86355.1 hypothetical protein CHGG_07608 [Chaetomium globosum CBS 148.51]